MKINGSTDPFRGLDRPGTSGAGAKADKAGTPAGGPESVQLSGLPEQLAKMMEQAGEVFDQSRVDAIKDAIKRGEFKVDSDVVADKLLQTVRDLVAK